MTARLKSICGTQGTVIQDDDDGTSQVRVVMPSRMTVWLPNSALTDVEVAADPEPDSKHGAVGDRGDESAALCLVTCGVWFFFLFCLGRLFLSV